MARSLVWRAMAACAAVALFPGCAPEAEPEHPAVGRLIEAAPAVSRNEVRVSLVADPRGGAPSSDATPAVDALGRRLVQVSEAWREPALRDDLHEELRFLDVLAPRVAIDSQAEAVRVRCDEQGCVATGADGRSRTEPRGGDAAASGAEEAAAVAVMRLFDPAYAVLYASVASDAQVREGRPARAAAWAVRIWEEEAALLGPRDLDLFRAGVGPYAGAQVVRCLSYLAQEGRREKDRERAMALLERALDLGARLWADPGARTAGGQPYWSLQAYLGEAAFRSAVVRREAGAALDSPEVVERLKESADACDTALQGLKDDSTLLVDCGIAYGVYAAQVGDRARAARYEEASSWAFERAMLSDADTGDELRLSRWMIAREVERTGSLRAADWSWAPCQRFQRLYDRVAGGGGPPEGVDPRAFYRGVAVGALALSDACVPASEPVALAASRGVSLADDPLLRRGDARRAARSLARQVLGAAPALGEAPER